MNGAFFLKAKSAIGLSIWAQRANYNYGKVFFCQLHLSSKYGNG